jgi:hypothetical protein
MIVGAVALVLVVGIASAVGAVLLLRSAPGAARASLYTCQAQATAAAQPTIANHNYEFKDGLTGAIPLGWSKSQSCYFQNAAYHVNPGSIYGQVVCAPPTGTFYDLDMRVTASEASGPPSNGYGVAFRDQSTGNGYVFLVDGAGYAWFETLSSWTVTNRSDFGIVPSFASGPGGQNTLRLTLRTG